MCAPTVHDAMLQAQTFEVQLAALKANSDAAEPSASWQRAKYQAWRSRQGALGNCANCGAPAQPGSACSYCGTKP
jgi:cell division septation protein DedD